MVDRQTPAVKSDDEMARQAEAVREVSSEPREAEADVDARHEASLRRDIDRELGADRDADASRRAADDQARAAASEPATRLAQGEAALFDQEAAEDFQERWLVIQTEFVDEPGAAVKKAEALVGEVVTQLTESFARERESLESRWSGSDDVSTEDLRQAIRRYRSFFNRLLAI